jgi:hypothetical protein
MFAVIISREPTDERNAEMIDTKTGTKTDTKRQGETPRPAGRGRTMTGTVKAMMMQVNSQTKSSVVIKLIPTPEDIQQGVPVLYVELTAGEAASKIASIAQGIASVVK